MFETFKLNVADDKCYLQSARLIVVNGIYYPEIEYSYDNIIRIFKAVNNYVYKQNDKHTGSLLSLKNFEELWNAFLLVLHIEMKLKI